jgi:predicted lipid-binding transport protein (Tim44 family)
MKGMRSHLKLKGTALAASVPLLAPAAAHASSAGSTTQGGWGWWDAAIWGGALLGIVLLGFFGDRVIGTLIFGIAAVVSSGAALVASTGRHVGGTAQARTERGRPSAVTGRRPQPRLQSRGLRSGNN